MVGGVPVVDLRSCRTPQPVGVAPVAQRRAQGVVGKARDVADVRVSELSFGSHPFGDGPHVVLGHVGVDASQVL